MGSRRDPPPYDARGYNGRPNEQEFDIRPDDIVIGVMGMTGVGKSSFITLFTGEDNGPTIGHDLHSCTNEVEIYPCTLRNGVRVVLVDTPGFDDSDRSDTDVLRDIANFLSTTYSDNILLTGLIYLHRITDVRVPGAAVRNLSMFKSLCGNSGLSSVVLVTTMWNQLVPIRGRDVGQERLQDLRQNFWGDMLSQCKMLQHDGNLQSAEEILGYLINQRRHVVLDIQNQMVNERLDLSDTGAGRQLNAEMLAQQEKFQEEMERFHREAEDAQRERDLDTERAMRKLESQYRDKIDRIQEDKRRLDVDLERLRAEEAQQARMNAESGKKVGRKTRWLLRGLGAVTAWTATVLTAGALGPASVAGLGALEAGLQMSKRR